MDETALICDMLYFLFFIATVSKLWLQVNNILKIIVIQ